MSEPTEWGTRISNAAQALGKPSEDLTSLLAETFGITEAEDGLSMLDDEEVFKFGDFREAVKAPIAKLRLAFKHLRGGKKAADRGTADARTSALLALGHEATLEDAQTADLLRLYDPSKGPSDPVTRILAYRYPARPIIAFKDDGSVAVEECAAYIADTDAQRCNLTDKIMVNGQLVKLWPVGTLPNIMLDEDPLFPGVALHSGRSQRNYLDWSKVEIKERRLCRIILERGDINVGNREAITRLLERAEEKKLVTAYPEADLDYREREREERLPLLKVSIHNQKPNNPFGVKRTY